jgi:sialic acid synthase SpsE/sugar phosphate isomerase/epimerase/CBS domain-containing protein
MFIERSIARYVVFADETILTALTKISINKSGFVCVINEHGHAIGMITDGDVRRWLTGGDGIDLEAPVQKIANSDFKRLGINTPPEEIALHLSTRIKAVPLLDTQGRLVAIAISRPTELSINGRLIGPDQPCYIIAEIGNNHQGSVELAKQLVDLAVDAGVDCVKFQMRDMVSLYESGGDSDNPAQDLGTQYTLDLLSRFNLVESLLFSVFDHCKVKGVEPLCTPWDLPSLSALEAYGMSAYKVASADLTNHDLVEALIATGKPLICSTGMAAESEIRELVSLLQGRGATYCLLHTNSTYPAPFKDINLRYMDRLGEIGQCPIGYSGHERGYSVALAAVARGACVIEKHFTVDRSLEGNDHKVSLLPAELAEMVPAIRAVESSLGTRDERMVTQGEMMNREILSKSMYARENIPAGSTITNEMIVIQSPGQGLQPNKRTALVGKIARRLITKNTPFFPTDLEDIVAEPRPYSFNRPWGLPVRWHDYRAMMNLTNLDLLEYHLSYKDMDSELTEWFKEPLETEFLVHAPELFQGDHILDLTSRDEDYRARSVIEMQRVIDLTRSLKKWHPRTSTPLIITNVGGFSTVRQLPSSDRAELYKIFEKSLAELDLDGVEIIPQTMPPFPWHFGGQSYHNLFMDPAEIDAFCKKNGMRVCLDVSHSQLACNEFHWSMREFCETVGPHSAHLHVVDAKGVDGEGLQIGEGNIDFTMIGDVFDKTCPTASFVPEVWQGHKNNGQGFWIALELLEGKFSPSSQKA